MIRQNKGLRNQFTIILLILSIFLTACAGLRPTEDSVRVNLSNLVNYLRKGWGIWL